MALKDHARRLRREMTEAEAKLWSRLRDRRLLNAKFRRQVPVGPFIADFLAKDHRLVIEVDGSQHADSDADAKRDAWFVANGYRVLRFWNSDVLARTDDVLETIAAHLVEPCRLTPEENRRSAPKAARRRGVGGAHSHPERRPS